MVLIACIEHSHHSDHLAISEGSLDFGIVKEAHDEYHCQRQKSEGNGLEGNQFLHLHAILVGVLAHVLQLLQFCMCIPDHLHQLLHVSHILHFGQSREISELKYSYALLQCLRGS